MNERIWGKFLTERDKAVFAAGGFGARAGFGKRPALLGSLFGSFSAFVAIGGLLRILERFSAWPFAVYRAFIGAVLLAGVATGWLG